MTARASSAPQKIQETPGPLGMAWRRFKRSKVGVFGGFILVLMYLMALFSGFLSPYAVATQFPGQEYQRPQAIQFFHNGQLSRPFIYPITLERDPVTFQKKPTEDRTKPLPIYFFTRGDEYNLLGFRTNLHLFGVGEGNTFFAFGTDQVGRDLLSRTLVGAQVSLTVGLVGILISFTIGIFMGGISGYYGGWVDVLIQRVVEVLLSFPRLPILLALAAILPARWPSTWVYLGIVATLAFIGWASLARVVRGQMLSAKNLEYVAAARALGVSDLRIILRHVMPNLSSFLVVTATLALPGYILSETALSFLGVGIKEPMTSWGLLLKDNNINSVALYPWLLLPGLFVVVAVLAFNFFGDALRDAADTSSK
ncbi:MAG: ABC transporter permease [Pseudopedobacter sp.]|nr:ABC transporter permease [Deinococcales bacterium]